MKQLTKHIIILVWLSLSIGVGAAPAAVAEESLITLPRLALQSDDAIPTASQQIELINATGRQRAVAIGLSLIPGLGQFYNQDYLAGSLYLGAAAAVLVIDGVMYFSNGGNSPTSPLLLGLPALSAASMIHAGLQTQERAQIQFSF